MPLNPSLSPSRPRPPDASWLRRLLAGILAGPCLSLAACGDSGIFADLSTTPAAPSDTASAAMPPTALTKAAAAPATTPAVINGPGGGGGGSSGTELRAEAAAAAAPPQQAMPESTIWNSPDQTSALAMASGDGVNTTASSVNQLLNASSSIYFGPRVAKEDWPGLIARYKRDASVASWVKTETARIDSWIARKFERADLVGGWQMHNVNPGSGQSEPWTPERPEPADGTTDAQRNYKAAWVANGRDYNIAQMQAAARLFRLTGNEKYAAWAAQQLDFYAEHYATWPLRTSEGRSRMYMQGLDEATATFQLVDTARLLDSYAGSARTRRWRDALFMPMALNLKSTSAPMSNIQIWHMGAIAAIAMRYGDTALLDYAQNGPQGIKANMADGLTVDNFWKEGTFSYNAYMVTALSKILVQAGVEGHADRFSDLRDQAIRMLLVTLDYRFDDNSLPNPNDSRGAQQVVPKGPHWMLFRVTPTYWGLKVANEWRTWESLLDPPQAVPGSAPALPTAQTRNFTSMRQAVLRAGEWQAFVHYGQINGNHYQREMLNYELHFGRTAISYDAGTVDYSSPHHQGYFAMGPANNVPLIDGNGQAQWASGNLLSFSASENRLVAEQPKYLPDARVVRGYRVTSEGFAELSTFTVAGGGSRRLGIVFNTTCDVQLGSGSSPAHAIEPLPTVGAMGYWTQVRMFNGVARWTARLDCGDGKRFQFTVSGPAVQRIYLVKAPNTPMPATRNTLYYETTGSNADFQTEIRQALN